MKAKWPIVVGVLLGVAVLGLIGGWYARNRAVVWGISEPGLKNLLVAVGQNLIVEDLSAASLPWDKPDLTLRWLDPWSVDSPDPVVQTLSGPPPRDLLAFEVFGLLSAPSTLLPPDFPRWLADLDKKVPRVAPLAVAGKTDAELMNLILWFGEGVLGPEALASSFTALAIDPSASVDPSGTLSASHPWTPVLQEIRRWSAAGRLVPNWWDYTDVDVKNAVAEGKARWGLTWSGIHYSTAVGGVLTTAFRIPPAWPQRRSFSLVGRWLYRASTDGWGDRTLVDETRKRLSSVAVSQMWLSTEGLLMADPALPAVNQESKALGIGFLSAGALVAGPSAVTDLSRWTPLLDAARTVLRR